MYCRERADVSNAALWPCIVVRRGENVPAFGGSNPKKVSTSVAMEQRVNEP
jgi:hypothetical protein